jgi:hypothetical protein
MIFIIRSQNVILDFVPNSSCLLLQGHRINVCSKAGGNMNFWQLWQLCNVTWSSQATFLGSSFLAWKKRFQTRQYFLLSFISWQVSLKPLLGSLQLQAWAVIEQTRPYKGSSSQALLFDLLPMLDRIMPGERAPVIKSGWDASQGHLALLFGALYK